MVLLEALRRRIPSRAIIIKKKGGKLKDKKEKNEEQGEKRRKYSYLPESSLLHNICGVDKMDNFSSEIYQWYNHFCWHTDISVSLEKKMQQQIG